MKLERGSRDYLKFAKVCSDLSKVSSDHRDLSRTRVRWDYCISKTDSENAWTLRMRMNMMYWALSEHCNSGFFFVFRLNAVIQQWYTSELNHSVKAKDKKKNCLRVLAAPKRFTSFPFGQISIATQQKRSVKYSSVQRQILTGSRKFRWWKLNPSEKICASNWIISKQKIGGENKRKKDNRKPTAGAWKG